MGYACAAGVPAIEAFVTAHNMTAPDLLRSARPLVNGYLISALRQVSQTGAALRQVLLAADGVGGAAEAQPHPVCLGDERSQ